MAKSKKTKPEPRFDLSGLDLKESWFWDEGDVVKKFNASRRRLLKLQRERRTQPPLLIAWDDGEIICVSRYRILQPSELGRICIESRRSATEEEKKLYDEHTKTEA